MAGMRSRFEIDRGRTLAFRKAIINPDPTVPTEARLAARVIVIDARERVLFFRAEEPATGHCFWVMPGGGLDAGESFEAAVQRELFEETGISASIGPCVWCRRHRHRWNGRDADQFEKFFLVRIECGEEICGPNPDGYVTGFRWWSMDELQGSSDDFAPRRVADLLPMLMRSCFPIVPIDCGV